MERLQTESIIDPEHVEAGQGHFRNAQTDYDKAEKLFAMKQDFIPHANPTFRSPLVQAEDYAREALNSLQYAEEFGGVEQDQIIEFREKIQILLKAIQDKKIFLNLKI